ncbi:MAG: hypothetical protein KGL39_50040 [Patescibacteria group bacterium]|nr:hypothetical protein [Patescibacteria group bacterium]
MPNSSISDEMVIKAGAAYEEYIRGKGHHLCVYYADAMRAALRAIEPEPASNEMEVVERMLKAFYSGFSDESALSSINREGMSRALKAARDAGAVPYTDDTGHEIHKRLKGLFITLGLGDYPGDWWAAVNKMADAIRAQAHLSQLCSERYNRIVELERQLAEPHDPVALPEKPIVLMPDGERIELDDPRVLGPLAPGEAHLAVKDVLGGQGATPIINNFTASRLAALQPNPKTPEERVTIEEVGGMYTVCDGKLSMYNFRKREDAEFYRRGFIQTLKEEANGSLQQK